MKSSKEYIIAKLKLYFILALIGAIIYFIYLIRQIAFTLFISLFLAFAFHPIVDFFERKRIGRSGGTVIVLLVVFVLLGIILLYFIPTLINQIQIVARNFPKYIDALQKFYFNSLVPWVKKNLNYQLPKYKKDFQVLFSEKFQKYLPLLFNALQTGIKGAFVGTKNIVLTAFYIFLVPFFLYFFLKDFNKFKEILKELIPLKYRSTFIPVLNEIKENLLNYFKGQLIVFTILTFIYSVGFLIIGLESAIALGIFSGMMFFIPYIGAWIAFLLVELLNLLNFSSWWSFLWIVILFIFATQLESWILTPKITGSQVGLKGWQVIILIMIFASIFGIIGVILAIPIGAVLKILVKKLYQTYKESSFYKKENETV